MMDIALRNLKWAETLIQGLASCGVAHAVISPGSRSTPLALACLRDARLKTWVQVDERSAAFFALGLAKAGNQPVMLVCTSGSAAANWYPAVIEADMGATPLILLTADRPPELRDCGANQAIDQFHLFGSHVRGFHELPCAEEGADMLDYLRTLADRVADQSRWPLPGPVHVNVPLREPLVPVVMPPILPGGNVASVTYPVMSLSQDQLENLSGELSGKRGMIVCGAEVCDAGFAEAVTQLAAKLACPVLADPLSSLRFGGHDQSAVLTRYDAFLRRTSAMDNLKPDWVLRFGAPPVSKYLNRFLETLQGVPQFLVEAKGRWPDPLRRVTQLFRVDALSLCRQLSSAGLRAATPEWMQAFAAEEQRAAQHAAAHPPLEAAVVQSIIRQLAEPGLVFVGNSMAVREFDSYAAGASKSLRVFGNRGASGIDGNVSTVLGLAAGSQCPLVALLGDLTFYHDMNGLAAAKGLNVVFVVLNNGGGGIFSYLEQARLEAFERAWLTPLDLDFSLAACMYGLTYHKTSDADAFDSALSVGLKGGAHLIEVSIDREDSIKRHQDYWHAVTR